MAVPHYGNRAEAFTSLLVLEALLSQDAQIELLLIASLVCNGEIGVRRGHD